MGRNNWRLSQFLNYIYPFLCYCQQISLGFWDFMPVGERREGRTAEGAEREVLTPGSALDRLRIDFIPFFSVET